MIDPQFPVSRLPGLLAAGETKKPILDAYPYLEADDVEETLGYVATCRKKSPSQSYRAMYN